jgi:hypothetical protein
LKQYNTAIAGNKFAAQAVSEINSTLFQNVPTNTTKFQFNTTNGLTDSIDGAQKGSKLFFEYGNNGASTMDFTTAGKSAVIVLGPTDAVKFLDQGSAGDKGDIIIGSNADQWIGVTQGNNLLVAGAGHSTLVGGAGDDTLVGGGLSELRAGSGAGNQSLEGGAKFSASDTLYGGTGSGTDILKVFKGDNSIYSGSNNETIISGDKGNGVSDGSGGISGGDNISLTGGGNDLVKIGGGKATDTVTYNGVGHDTITNTGKVDIEIQHGVTLDSITTAGGNTILTFAGSNNTLEYTGTGSVTVHFQ